MIWILAGSLAVVALMFMFAYAETYWNDDQDEEWPS